MATKPRIVTLTNSSADILNVIRNNATVDYRNYVPEATNNAESIREIGAIIMDFPALQNEFLNALINRIGRVMISSKLYENPIRMFKKGIMEFGETMEDIYVNLVDAQQFDPDVAEETLFKRELPDVRSAFYTMNYQKFYKVTVSYAQLKQAFLSINGVNDLVSKIIEQLYTSANYDEFLVMKYMLAKQILNGRLYPVSVGANPEVSPKYVATEVKAQSNALEFLTSKYNVAGVYNATLKDNQYVLINSRFSAIMDIEVLASAFNMSKAEFMGHIVMVDGFGELDTPRLNKLFADDKTYKQITSDEIEALNKIPVVLVDDNYFMVYDNLIEMRDVENGQGLYWNYNLHTWKTFNVSPFSNAIVFIPMASQDIGVDSITLTPASMTVPATYEGSFGITPEVETSGFISKVVNYTVDTQLPAGLKVTVSKGGIVTVEHTDEDTTSYNIAITITVSSTYDPTVTAEFTLTVGTPT